MPILLLVLCPGRIAHSGEAIAKSQKEDKSSLEIKKRVYAQVHPEEEKSFLRLPPPKDGDWLAHFRERPQPLPSYKMQNPNRPTAARRTIVLQPLGAFGEREKKTFAILKEYAAVYFQLPVRVEKAIPLPDPKTNPRITRVVPVGQRHGTYERQYNAPLILEKVLLPRLPKDAYAYMGITMEDLWMRKLNFLFGLGSLKEAVGVYSLCRYYPRFWGMPDSPRGDKLGLLRSLKLLNHESGHIFGLGHCVFYRCSMNGTNSLRETDRAPIHYCPVCHHKLQWNVGLDAGKRFGELESFYRKHGFIQQANWMTQRKARWKKVTELSSADEDE